MATRQTFAHEIAGRARRIGWPVEMGKDGGWNIQLPSGKIVQVHLTPSDKNAPDTILRALNKEGFEEAEAEWVRLSEEARREKLRAIQEKNQRELDKAQQHADALARATGQQRVSEDVLLTPYPLPKTFERVLITPELANKLLNLNTENRPIRQREVNVWKTIIENGEWKYTHQGIAIDSRGILQDGQHRLSAIMQTDTPVELQISIGMPPENFAAIDTNIRRTFGDVASRHGLPNRNRVGTASRLLIIYKDYPRRQMTDRVSNTEVDILLRHRTDTGETMGERIAEACSVGQSLWRGFRINTAAAAVGICLLWELLGRDNPKVEDFVKGLLSPANIEASDARFVLRRLMTSPSFKNRTAWHHLALFIKAWNKWLANEEVTLLSFRKGEDLPKVLVEEE